MILVPANRRSSAANKSSRKTRAHRLLHILEPVHGRAKLPRAVLGPVDFWAFRRLASIFACETMLSSLKLVRLQPDERGRPTKARCTHPESNHYHPDHPPPLPRALSQYALHGRRKSCVNPINREKKTPERCLTLIRSRCDRVFKSGASCPGAKDHPDDFHPTPGFLASLCCSPPQNPSLHQINLPIVVPSLFSS